MTTASYGSWPSPLSAHALASGLVRLSDLQVDGDTLLWTELRPSEGGRTVLVRHTDGSSDDLTPPGESTRTRVHEYGGAPFAARDGVVVASRFRDQRLCRLDDSANRPLSPAPSTKDADRFAEMQIVDDHVLCVHESHHDGNVRNQLSALSLEGGAPQTLVSGRDFVAAPRVSPDGRKLAWLTWDLPFMPWDSSELWVADLDLPAGSVDDARRVAGGDGSAATEPMWHPELGLLFSLDRSGWWNLYRAEGDGIVALTDLEMDIGEPLWVLGSSVTCVLADGRVALAPVDHARSRLGILDPSDGSLTWQDSPWTRISYLRAHGDGLAFIGQSPGSAGAVVHRDPDGQEIVVRRVEVQELRPADTPQPEPVTIPTPDGEECHAFYYAPHNAEVDGPSDERPPLLVFTHGGPTANVFPVLNLDIAFWTTRGFAVVDVNYRGSTGYGRAYREGLYGQWGVHDVTDCIAAARFLADRGDVDPDRLAIRGGSAGGYTTLAALTAEEDVFAAGASYYGVAEIAELMAETHKFESGYGDQLIGPLSEAEELYRERSPLTNVDRLRTPVIVFQGAEDEVVPPAQSRAIVEAAAERDLPHAYLEFEGEQHGFRDARHIVEALESELAFYGQVMGFEPADDVPALDLT